MTTSPTIRRGTVVSAFAAIACALLLALPASSNALPGKRVAIDTATDEAFLAKPELFSTSPNACFDTFKELYPCLRIRKPKAIWVSGYYSGEVGWEFGTLLGWEVSCKKGRRIGTREQLNRDGLAEGEFWVGRKTIKLPLPMRNPAWCEVNVEGSSPYYVPGFDLWWDTEMIVNSSVEIRAISRRR